MLLGLGGRPPSAEPGCEDTWLCPQLWEEQGHVLGSEGCTIPLRVTIKPDPLLRPPGSSLLAPPATFPDPETSRPMGPSFPPWPLDREAGWGP